MATHINRLRCAISNAPGSAGDLTIAAAASGHRAFVAAQDGKSFDVVLTDGTAWEVRTGCVYTHSTTTLTRGTLADSSTGSAIALTATTLVTVGPVAGWFTSADSIGAIAPTATGDAQTDYAQLSAAITAAGVGGAVRLPRGQTYLLGTELVLLSGQKFEGNNSILKLANQVSSNITSSVTINGASANASVTFQVASATGFWVGRRVAVSDLTVGGQRTATRVTASVTAVAGNNVTVVFDNSAGDQMYSTTNLTTWLETGGTSYVVPVGAVLCTISTLLQVESGADGVQLFDLTLDGNAANNTLGRRWETSPALNFRGTSGRIRGLTIRDAASDAMYHGGVELDIDGIRIDRPCAMGIHFGATTGSTGAMRTDVRNVWIDSPGMGDPTIGHYGGYNSSHPAYGALGFSRLTNHVIIQGGHITNDSGTVSTYGTGITSITAGDNWAIQFDDLHISGFNKGLGPLLMVRSSAGGGYTSTPTDPPGDYAQAASSITFSRTRFDSCYPPTFATADQWQMCVVGANSGTFPQFVRIRFIDCEWLDSPMVIQESQVEFSGVNAFIATSVAKSSTLTIGGSTSDVDVTGVVFRRPVTTSGNIGTEPGWYQYNVSLYPTGGKVYGNGAKFVGGSKAIRIQNGASLDLTGALFVNQYTYGIHAMSATTRVTLRGARVVLESGFTANSGWVGVDFASGGGALGAGGYAALIGCDFEAVTTAAGQYCVRLPSDAAAKASLLASKVKVSGTSTTPVASGGAVGVGVVVGNLLSHTFTPGAAETSSGNVVSANS